MHRASGQCRRLRSLSRSTMNAAELGERLYPSALLLFSPAALYIAARAMMEAIEPPAADPIAMGNAAAARVRQNAPLGRRAVAQWLPIVITALFALLLRQPELAVTLVFASSIALLSLVLGMVGYLSPQGEAPTRFVGWSFIAPAGLLCLVAGFGGALNWINAMMLLIIGVLILWAAGEKATDALPAVPFPGRWPGSVPKPRMLSRGVHIGLALMLLCLGGWGAAGGAVASAHASMVTTPALVGATVLAPLLVLPALATSTRVAPQQGTAIAVAALVRTALLNLFVLLPILILGQYALSRWATFPTDAAADVVQHLPASLLHPATWPHALSRYVRFTGGGPAASLSLIFPMPLWRIDAAMVTVIGFALMPIGTARWKLQRGESALLILGYVVYLLAVMRASR